MNGRVERLTRWQRRLGLLVGLTSIVALALAGGLAARPLSMAGRDVAAKDLLIDLKPRSHLFQLRFPDGRVRTRRTGLGVLVFTTKSSPDHGRISCILSSREGKVRKYGCRWVFVIQTHAVYWGLALITIYDPRLSGHNFELFWSKCRNRDRTHFCKKHPPPHPG